MGKGSGLTRGDARRNERKARLRALVPYSNVVLGLDLGEKKQAMLLADRDGRAVWRRSPQVRVHELGRYLDAAAERAAQAGFAGVTVACEPTGSRWMTVQELCRARQVPYVLLVPSRLDNSTQQASFWRPAVRFLRAHEQPGYRVEVVPTAEHWEAYWIPRSGLPLARGWYRQLDTADNPTLYKTHLGAAAYRSYLAIHNAQMMQQAREVRALAASSSSRP